jgi:Ankyrin repeat
LKVRQVHLFYDVIQRGDLCMCQQLVDSGTNVNSKVHEYSPLFCALAHKKLAVVEYLISHGADVNYHDCEFCMFGAFIRGNKKFCRMLVAAGFHFCDIDALKFAAVAAHFVLAECLLSTGIVTIAAGRCILAELLASHSLEKRTDCNSLLSRSAQLFPVDESLHNGESNGSDPVPGTEDAEKALVELFISAGADVDAGDEDDPTALFLCNSTR